MKKDKPQKNKSDNNIDLDKDVKVVPINRITEKEKIDYTNLVLTQTKSF